tara:strand:- start:2540 stop:3313 length:774 start_codon:yes stop_codon:yes gene_type:complete
MKAKFTILGCGSSLGVPRADGFWGNCDYKEKKNYRTRCSAFIKSDAGNILIDTSPDLRVQLIKNNIKKIDHVLYTHMHGDQVHGINDLRVFSLKLKKKIPVYADIETRKYLKNNFSYCFFNTPSYKSILKLNNLKRDFYLKKKGKSISIKSIKVQHGLIKSQSFIVNKSCAYISDANKIYQKDFMFLKNIKFLVIDCFRFDTHFSHFCLKDIIKLNSVLKPHKTILTNLSTELDYNYLVKNLPKKIIPAYDGMSFYI